MTIPEIQKRLTEIGNTIERIQSEQKMISENITELRSQLGLERMPKDVCAQGTSEPPVNRRY